MYTPASNYVEGVDLAFKIIFGIGIFFLIGITLAMVLIVIRYRRKVHPVAEQINDNIKLELVWITVPTLLVLLMFYYGYVAFSPQLTPPKDSIPVKVIGRMWYWTFEYQGGKQSPDLVVPLNKPVKLDLFSDNVIHGFFIPSFRIKQDVVPGKNNFLWFVPTRVGEYEIFCTAFCGLRHAYMESKVKVIPEKDYNAWLAALSVKSEEPEGLAILKKNACIGCHSLDGSKLVSVSFKGLFGKHETVVTDGKERTLTVDADYIKMSIFDPDKDLTKGFSKGIMKTYKGVVSDEDVKKITEYLQTLK